MNLSIYLYLAVGRLCGVGHVLEYNGQLLLVVEALPDHVEGSVDLVHHAAQQVGSELGYQSKRKVECVQEITSIQ